MANKVKIVQFKVLDNQSTSAFESPSGSGIVIIGLGSDSKMYTWDGEKRKWLIFGEKI